MDNQSNPQLELAHEYVYHTHKNIFLTGKAGTGKTTFLRKVQEDCLKRMVVVAPTGVAAINAGGMTIHSMFQLPFGPLVPGKWQEMNKRRYTLDKIQLLQSLDLLVIDEISMVRADVLDAIDEVLRKYKNWALPFGGVQLLMIGDLHQLPPVVKDEEWDLLRDHYQTAYFFGSKALQLTDPVTIELKHIFRQSDDYFINLLNKVRDNKMDEETLATLNSRYIRNFEPGEGQSYITLTSHNASAYEINMRKLKALEGQHFRFNASITGDFPSYAYPTDEVFECKVGAQVMFVKNDLSHQRRYYNGKIGEVTKVEEDTLYVRCPGDYDDIRVTRDEWKNLKYSLNEATKDIEEEAIGVFTQFPLKLAWAITIHKSQGLTFERAVIDAQAAFAHGQVYVALSRCKTFEGIVLSSKIDYSSVRTDTKVKNFSEAAEKNAPDGAHLERSKAAFQGSLILELFDFQSLNRHCKGFYKVYETHAGAMPKGGSLLVKNFCDGLEADLYIVSQKFRSQINSYLAQPGMPVENAELQERLQKANGYFEEKVKSAIGVLTNLPTSSDNKAAKKLVLEALEKVYKELFVKKVCLSEAKPTFDPVLYLKAKSNAAIDFKMLKESPSATSKKASGSSRPELYEKLEKWRQDLADAYGVDAYQVLPLRSFHQIIDELPSDLKKLKAINGIGKAKLGQFGKELVALVREYLLEMKMDVPPEEPLEEKTAKPDTKLLSYEMFQSGKTIAEIATERGFVSSTIEGHLAHFIAKGELDVLKVLPAAKFEVIEAYFLENPDALHAQAKEALGEDYSYGEIKMVTSHRSWIKKAEETI